MIELTKEIITEASKKYDNIMDVLANRAALDESLFKDELNNEQQNKAYVTYSDIQNCVGNASEIMTEKFDTILCITRGGLIPAGMLAYELGIKNIVNINASSYNDDNTQEEYVKITKLSKKEIKKLNAATKILIVDDIIDSGNTIEAINQYLFEHVNANIEYKTFAIVTKKLELSDYFIYDMTNDERWVVFPWDK